MKTLISMIILKIAILCIPMSSLASSNTSIDETRALKKVKKDIEAIKAKYYQPKAGEVMGDESTEKNYYVKINTNLPVASMKSLSKMRTSGKNSSGSGYSRSQFSQGGCDNSVKGICNAH